MWGEKNAEWAETPIRTKQRSGIAGGGLKFRFMQVASCASLKTPSQELQDFPKFMRVGWKRFGYVVIRTIFNLEKTYVCNCCLKCVKVRSKLWLLAGEADK